MADDRPDPRLVSPDCFVLLGVPRQPWLDPDVLRQRFLDLSSQCHPDVHPEIQATGSMAPGRDADERREAVTGRFATLNSAYQTLRDTKSRLGHLLEIETGQPPRNVQAASAAGANLFFQVGALCREVDAFVAERSRASSALAKAALFARGLEWTARLQDLQQTIARSQAAFDAELKEMNPFWSDAARAGVERDPGVTPTARPLSRLEEIYRQLSFLGRWSAQLQERLVQLAV